ncbi:MAG TPA: cytochrome P450 [Actinophytocola sp.]|uniref:cytochrome P450 n=1 Tax=Actinophytocola sp. TaxID=1872138 RepID=UPI002DB737F6|nr:cytochrome P450 [Actinophytocola sp.]HEU5475591.1 cytochrome P450 [Actinophytocola sp.]
MDRRTLLRGALALSGLSLLSACDSLPASAGRTVGLVSFSEKYGVFIASSYADVAKVLHGEGWSNDIRTNLALLDAVGGAGGLPPVLTKMALFSDAPAHTRLRELVAPTVTGDALARFRPRVVSIVDSVLAGRSGRIDVLAELGYPISTAVSTELFGLGPAGAALISKELPRLSGMLELGAGKPILLEAMDAVGAFTRFLMPIVAERRARPGSDLLSDILTAANGGDRLDDEEAVATVLLMLLGQETTAQVIGNGVFALLSYRDQLELLRLRPELAGPAVDEILRFYGPVKISGRTALVDQYVGEQHIRPGQPLLLDIFRANRDPDRFPDPDTLRIDREDGMSVGFGIGPHLCLGRAMVHLQVEQTLLRLFGRYSGIRLPGPDEWQPAWRDSTAFRSLTELPVLL